MSFFKIKRSPADKYFSDWIRHRDKMTCQRCFVDLSNYLGQLDNSHYFGRGNKSTRWDEDNCVALCKACHMYLGDKDNKKEYDEFMLKRLGQRRFDGLFLRAHLTARQINIDEKLVGIFYKAAVNEINKQILGHREKGD